MEIQIIFKLFDHIKIILETYIYYWKEKEKNKMWMETMCECAGGLKWEYWYILAKKEKKNSR